MREGSFLEITEAFMLQENLASSSLAVNLTDRNIIPFIMAEIFLYACRIDMKLQQKLGQRSKAALRYLNNMFVVLAAKLVSMDQTTEQTGESLCNVR